MIDEAAFIRTICEKPGDNGPRLVYADWLEERGECDRGEFIRAQCELANIELKPDNLDEKLQRLWCREDFGHECRRRIWEPECRWHKLRARERELLTHENVTTWAPPLRGVEPASNSRDYGDQDISEVLEGRAVPLAAHHGCWAIPNCGLVDFDFGRGFPARVSLPAAALMGEVCACVTPFSGAEMPSILCNRCDGSGRTPGLRSALAALRPRVRVVLSDRELVQVGNDQEWPWNWMPGNPERGSPYRISQEIFDLIDLPRATVGGEEMPAKCAASPALALAALESAATAWVYAEAPAEAPAGG